MRDYFLLVIVIGLVPVILKRPWIGVLAWFWVGLMAPHGLTWGFMRTFPLAMIFGLATLVALFFAKERRPLPSTSEIVLMFVFVAYVTMTSALAINPDAWGFWWHFMKILLITFVTPVLIFGQRRILLLLLVITLSLAFYGFKGGLFAISTGGNYMVLGPPGSYLAGNTYIGLAMIMVLPLVLVSARLFYNRWAEIGVPLLERFSRPIGWALYATFWLSCLAILATQSRGALLGLLAIVPFLYLRMRGKLVMAGLAFLAVVVVGVTAPDRLVERWKTIENYEQDTSAMQRIQSWGANWNMALERPLTGMGFRNAGMGYDWWIGYAEFEGTWDHVLSPHSIYFGLLGQHGFGGLLVFLLLIGSTLLTLNRIRKTAKQRPGQIWLSEYAWALQVAIFGYLIAGAFLDVAYFSLLYAFIALAIVMRRELDEAPATQAGQLVVAEPPAWPGAPAGNRLRFPDFVAPAPVRQDEGR